MYHHFASSYPAVQSISQAEVQAQSQKAEVQSIEARDHLQLPSRKAPSWPLCSSGRLPRRAMLAVDILGTKGESE